VNVLIEDIVVFFLAGIAAGCALTSWAVFLAVTPRRQPAHATEAAGEWYRPTEPPPAEPFPAWCSRRWHDGRCCEGSRYQSGHLAAVPTPPQMTRPTNGAQAIVP